jgi:hypothetical protein
MKENLKPLWTNNLEYALFEKPILMQKIAL